jgi:hypothetical protein
MGEKNYYVKLIIKFLIKYAASTTAYGQLQSSVPDNITKKKNATFELLQLRQNVCTKLSTTFLLMLRGTLSLEHIHVAGHVQDV